MSSVISASRRTDIPALYSEWLVNRLQAGFAFVPQPYSGKMTRVSLRADDVAAIVLWSKNYRPLLDKLEAIEQMTQNLFFHFTITANRDLELSTPDFREAIKDYIFISKRYAPDRIVWRFDPICITDRMPFDVAEERFVRCAALLQGHADACIISLAHPYKKTLKNVQRHAQQTLLEVPDDKKREYVLRLAHAAESFGIRLFACCNDLLLSEQIRKASCIDGQAFSRIFSVPLDTRLASTRKECACTRSVDIGAYNTCTHGCLYCYANDDKDRASAAFARHDPSWNSLTRHVDESIEFAQDRQPRLL